MILTLDVFKVQWKSLNVKTLGYLGSEIWQFFVWLRYAISVRKPDFNGHDHIPIQSLAFNFI